MIINLCEHLLRLPTNGRHSYRSLPHKSVLIFVHFMGGGLGFEQVDSSR